MWVSCFNSVNTPGITVVRVQVPFRLFCGHIFTSRFHWALQLLGFELTTARIIPLKPVNYYSKFFITFFITFVRTESRRQILLRFQRKNSCQHSRYRNIFCSTWFLKRLKPITEKKSMLNSCHSTK